MSSAPDLITEQLSDVVDDYQRVSASEMEDYDALRIATRARAAIRRCAPPGSAYEAEAKEVDGGQGYSDQWRARQFVAIVHALRDDYGLGAFAAVEELVHADLFDDFLEMAGELLAKGFVGPAAVLAGTVLEEQLRKLADKHGLTCFDEKGRPRSVEVLGQDLRKAGVLTEVQRKSIAAWYAQRSEAAHGRTDGLHADDIERTIDGIRGFVARHPA
jgi:hypothetical protein